MISAYVCIFIFGLCVGFIVGLNVLTDTRKPSFYKTKLSVIKGGKSK